MPHSEILSSRFLTHGPRKLGLYFKTLGFKYYLMVWPMDWLINSKDEIFLGITVTIEPDISPIPTCHKELRYFI